MKDVELSILLDVIFSNSANEEDITKIRKNLIQIINERYMNRLKELKDTI